MFSADLSFSQATPEKIKSMINMVKDKRQTAATRKVTLTMLARENPPELMELCKEILLDNLDELKPPDTKDPAEKAPEEPKKPEAPASKFDPPKPKGPPPPTPQQLLKIKEDQKRKDAAAARELSLKVQDIQKLRELAATILTGIGGEKVFDIMRQAFDKEYFDEKAKKMDMNYSLLSIIIPNLAIGRKEEMVDLLYTVLFCRNEEVRTAAFNTMGDIGGSYALNPMLSCLEAKKTDIRLSIVRNVAKIRLDETLSPLVGLLMDDDEDVRKAVIKVLVGKDKDKVKKMGERMFSREINPERKALLRKGLDAVYRGGSK